MKYNIIQVKLNKEDIPNWTTVYYHKLIHTEGCDKLLRRRRNKNFYTS